jgi:hypothetical protein
VRNVGPLSDFGSHRSFELSNERTSSHKSSRSMRKSHSNKHKNCLSIALISEMVKPDVP